MISRRVMQIERYFGCRAPGKRGSNQGSAITDKASIKILPEVQHWEPPALGMEEGGTLECNAFFLFSAGCCPTQSGHPPMAGGLVESSLWYAESGAFRWHNHCVSQIFRQAARGPRQCGKFHRTQRTGFIVFTQTVPVSRKHTG